MAKAFGLEHQLLSLYQDHFSTQVTSLKLHVEWVFPTLGAMG